MTITSLRVRRPKHHLATLLAGVVIVASCGGSDDTSEATTASLPGSDATTTSTTEPQGDDLEAEITAILEGAMEPDAIDWTKNGLPGDPTAVTAGVRIEGREDVLVVVGTQVDGSPASATDPLPVAFTPALVGTVALQLLDEGVLDPEATVDAWAPDMPAADVTTVGSVIEQTAGWSRWGPPGDEIVLDDPERRWTLAEVVAQISPTVTVDPSPSVATTDEVTSSIILGHVLEQVTGEPLAALVADRIAGPLGLDDTMISDGSNPDGYRHGVFDFQGSLVDTSMFPGTAYLTWHTASASAVSSVPDLLDLLDAWHAGELFTTDRTPGPERFSSERAISAEDPQSYEGFGAPFNGYCPCTPTDAGHDVAVIGRAPSWTVLGVDLHALRYADGISVVLHFNSGQGADRTQMRAIVDAIHAAAAQAA